MAVTMLAGPGGRLRRVLIGFAILVALSLGALAVAPRFIAPGQYREIIAAGLRRATGRDVAIDGPITLSLLPVPTLSAGDVRFANPAGASDPDLLRIASLELRLGVAPLLTGHLVLRSVTLTDPILDVERLAGGSMNWQAPRSPGRGGPPAPIEGEGPGAGVLGILGEPSISVAALRIANGAVIYHGAGGTTQVDRLNLAVSAPEPDGPIRASGSVRARGALMTVDLECGRPGARTPLRLTIGLPGAAARAEFVGDVALPSTAAPSATGKLKLSGDDFAAVVALLGRRPPPMLAQKFALAGELSASGDDMKFDKVAITSDELRGSGTLRVTPAAPTRFSLSLALSRIDLDHLAATARPPLSGPAGTVPIPAESTQTAVAPVAASGGLAIPTDLRGTLDVSLEALIWRGGLVRDAHLQAALDHGEIAVSRLAASFPGGSDLSLNGTMTSPAGAPQFRGVLEANSDNLRRLLDWLGLDTGAVPADRLRKASLSSRFAATPDRVEVDGADLTLDATRLTGAANVALRQRIGIGARVSIDRLNLDAYLPPPGPPLPVSATAPHPAAPGAGGAAGPGLSAGILGGVDANLEATIDSLTWRGQPVRGVRFAGTLQQGELTVRDAGFADLVGASGTISGAVGGLGADTAHWRVSATLGGPEIGRVLRLAAPGLDTSDRVAGPFTAQLELQGEPSATALDATLQALGGKARVSGEARPDPAGGPAIDASIEAAHPSFVQLARILASSYQPAGGDPGAVTLSGKLSGTAERLTLGDASLAIGGLSVKGETTLERAGARPKLTGALSFGDVVLDRFLPARQTAALGAPRSGIWLAAAPSPGAGPPSAARSGAWSQEKLDLTPLGALDAEFTLTGGSLAYGGWRIDQPALAVTLQDSALEIGQLSGGFLGGSLEANGRLSGGAGESRALLSVTLRQAALKDALETAVGTGALAGRADLDLTLAASGSSLAALVGGLAGDARLASKDGTISGVDLAAVSERLTQLKRPTDLIELFHGLSGGTTRYSSLDGTFHIANGVMRSEDVRLVATGGESHAAVTVDLPAWLLHSRIEFRLTDHPAAPPFAMTLDGPLDAPRRIFDVNALERFLVQRGQPSPLTPAR